MEKATQEREFVEQLKFSSVKLPTQIPKSVLRDLGIGL
jgi:hypothetical protein